MWGFPLLVLLIGGGLYFIIVSKLLPFRYFRHGLRILTGRYNDASDPGEISHFQAVSTALASTIGMGNISGVAVAIAAGGPGAIFWMWISAIVGSATKFFTCTLAVMYRWTDRKGNIHGGPMYFIVSGLGKNWRPLAIFFSLAGMIGVLPLFQVNQLTQAIREIIIGAEETSAGNAINITTGVVIAILSAIIIFGGIRRIGNFASRIVPVMVILYFIGVLYIILKNYSMILPSIRLIFSDAFSGKAMLGGALGQLIILGIKRGTFSNESGLGTSPMAHGAARTKEPVREGLVAMFEPIMDTVIVCTLTALAVIITGVWKNPDLQGITITNAAFSKSMPGFGSYLLLTCVFMFSMTTLFSYPYYGAKCFGFVFGEERRSYYNYFYLGAVLFAAVASINAVINLIDGIYAMMAIPTMVSALLLSPKVMKEARRYFGKLRDDDKYKNSER